MPIQLNPLNTLSAHADFDAILAKIAEHFHASQLDNSTPFGSEVADYWRQVRDPKNPFNDVHISQLSDQAPVVSDMPMQYHDYMVLLPTEGNAIGFSTYTYHHLPDDVAALINWDDPWFADRVVIQLPTGHLATTANINRVFNNLFYTVDFDDDPMFIIDPGALGTSDFDAFYTHQEVVAVMQESTNRQELFHFTEQLMHRLATQDARTPDVLILDAVIDKTTPTLTKLVSDYVEDIGSGDATEFYAKYIRLQALLAIAAPAALPNAVLMTR